MLPTKGMSGRSATELIESRHKELTQLVETQGGFEGIDQEVKTELAQFDSKVVPPGRLNALPLIWGSIRFLAIYGKWSWWSKPKPPMPPSPL
jgi:hypothetical protein